MTHTEGQECPFCGRRSGQHTRDCIEGKPCGMEWHYGTVAKINHADPNSETGWHGIHGALTGNPSGLCSDCEQDWRDNFPGYALPRPLTLAELSR